ncbi:hypothetical protein V498_06789 [Pseudogymnoascus sp. VKM F-4517 (FW-2822)]|nr:hypothetical protein V498_06789 [Pseudogymnoascus sp. VKM F-4517 (FW-2822)]
MRAQFLEQDVGRDLEEDVWHEEDCKGGVVSDARGAGLIGEVEVFDQAKSLRISDVDSVEEGEEGRLGFFSPGTPASSIPDEIGESVSAGAAASTKCVSPDRIEGIGSVSRSADGRGILTLIAEPEHFDGYNSE